MDRWRRFIFEFASLNMVVDLRQLKRYFSLSSSSLPLLARRVSGLMRPVFPFSIFSVFSLFSMTTAMTMMTKSMPRIGLGSAESPPFDSMAVAAQTAVEIGVGLIDTAQNYGSEAAVGEGLRRSRVAGNVRDDAYILAKVDLCSCLYEDARARMRRQVQSTLSNLDVQFLDTVAFHWPLLLDKPVSDKEAAAVRRAAYNELELMVDEGLVHSIGLSNFNVETMDEVISFARHKPVLNEVS